MKKIFLVLLFCSLNFSIYSQSDAKNSKIRQLLDLTGSGKLGVQVIRNMIGVFQKSYPNVEQKFWEDFMNEIKPEELVNLIVPIYEKYYSEDDLDQLIKFYNTPVGKKTIETLPSITQESMAAGQTWGKQIAEKVIQRLKEKGYSQN